MVTPERQRRPVGGRRRSPVVPRNRHGSASASAHPEKEPLHRVPPDLAVERNQSDTASYLMEMDMLGDLLAEGVAAFGLSIEDIER